MRVLLAGLLLVVPLAASAQKAPECGAYPVGEPEHLCVCAAGPHEGPVWGNGPYTADSDICTAALHAGAIGDGGGRVIARAAPGLDAYAGSVSHGVTTSSYGGYPDSFVVVGGQLGAGAVACRMLAEGEESLTCTCLAGAEASGGVWGSGPYTGDSNACLAAIHAGVIGASGGPITIVAAPGQDSYPASTANGVTTSAWGSFGTSFEVRPSP